ncbi:MAG: undecaprenyl-diphosphate phosphatase [Planctomycetota bacterium]|jgi:undecaprenyl-diphosphatase
MDTTEAILLGLVQGATEFLPVSSSAHLTAAEAILGVQQPGLLVEVALHLGTLLAILMVFWRPLLRTAADGLIGAGLYLRGGSAQSISERAPLFPTALAVVVGSVPVAVAGVVWGETIESLFHSLGASGGFLCVTGVALLTSRLAPSPRTERVGAGRGFLIGLAQAAALLSGISRSAVTIVAGYWLGVERRAAARFAFVLAVPALVGAALWELGRGLPPALADTPGGEDPLIRVGALATGTLVSAAVGTVCLLLLLRLIERGRLHWFGFYCVGAGVLMVAAHFLL